MSIAAYRIEDLVVGMEESITVAIDLEAIETFVELTRDNHPLHTDRSYALKNNYNDVIAHGLLIASYSSTLIGTKLPGENALVLSQSFKYSNAVYPGDELKYIGKITEIDARFGIVTVKIIVRNQDQEKVASGNYSIKIRS